MAKNVQRVKFLKNNIVVIKKLKLNFGQVYGKIINQRKNRHSLEIYRLFTTFNSFVTVNFR